MSDWLPKSIVMAYISTDPRSPYFRAHWKDAHGKWCRRTTRKKNPREAQEVANEWEFAEKVAREHSEDESLKRSTLELFARKWLGPQSATPTCKQWFEEWLEGRKAAISKQTYTRYEFSVYNFLRLLGPRKEKPLDCILAQDVIAFRDKLIKQGKRAATVNMDLKIVRAALEKAKDIGHINRNPSYAVDLLSKHADAVQRQPFTQEQVKALLNASRGSDWHGAILMGYYTALRLSDVTNMKWSAIDMDVRVITLIPGKTRRLNKQVKIPIHDQLYAWLKEQPVPMDPNMPVFRFLKGYGSGGKSGLSEQFAKVIAKAGIQREYVRSGTASRATSPLSFHSLRHTFASELANKGIPAEIRMQLTGHSSLKVHQGYTHLEVETIRRAVDVMPSIEVEAANHN